jgi:hypothetical protein
MVHWMILIAKPWTIKRWSELKLANKRTLIWILKVNTHHVDLEWIEDRQPHVKAVVERPTSQGVSEAFRVHS